MIIIAYMLFLCCKSELVLRGWLTERGIFLLGVKANLFCVVSL